MNRYLAPKFRMVILFFAAIIFCNCNNLGSRIDKKPILLAERKAPLGWDYLKIFDDSSFEYILTGLRDKTVYPGTVSLRHDTLFFKYDDSIPYAGKIAIIEGDLVSYIAGKYGEDVRITFNKLTK